MKHNFGHFAIELGDGQREYVCAVALGSPEWSGVNPDRRAFMVFVANTGSSLMRLTEPMLVQDHENVTEAEVNQLLGVYAKYPRNKISYGDFIRREL